MKKRIILASQSPRRKELLASLGIDFSVDVSRSEEILKQDLAIEKQIEDLAMTKVSDVFERHPEAIVIACDTVVVFNNMILGKPRDSEDAKRMLRLLSGQTHEVITSVCIKSNKQTKVFSSHTQVKFYELREEEIEDYVASKDPMDKAGAYGIQGQGAFLVKEIHGDYYTVMGLPIGELYRYLREDIW